MAVRCVAEDRELTAAVSGEVDHHRAKEIMNQLEQQITAGLPRRLILDMRDVSFMDSSGIAVVLRAQRRLAALGGTVTVRGAPPQAMKVLRAAGLDRIIPFE